jgi:hypothetical protein
MSFISRRKALGVIGAGATAAPSTLNRAREMIINRGGSTGAPPPTPAFDTAATPAQPSLSELLRRKHNLERQAAGLDFNEQHFIKGYDTDVLQLEALKSISPGMKGWLLNDRQRERSKKSMMEHAAEELKLLLKRNPLL